ncbi:dehydrogenase [Paenibacillus mucilaginosus 3016]|uniref:Dehydrogenase n=1 Tax=Paenibacillus mucilaginosus 3016 TaxID=1116391 RepID=H6NHX6_9BACL|nr:Gfo/Idh/MocA family oxidoreductase [Paenibacillus mucilaginosus]AFC30197.1 dehydrogenase [Paenibacillus mucilaginosus 3016]WFA18842.1 Gfo/Idh/MocA family oxidoreductase [Paenibacillus mucilaginosus]
MQKNDGMNYAPKGKPNPVVKPGEFIIAAVALDHGHIYGMVNGLLEAGATLKWVYDRDPVKAEAFARTYPQVTIAASEEEILADPQVHLVAGAAVASKRCELGLRVMDAGKDYFTDKAPFTTLEQLEAARSKVRETGRKYMVYYSERLHVEAAVYAGQLVEQGAVGRVIQVTGFGPHRLNAPSRPEWFFQREHYGGILCDIGSHQIEQFLFYAGCKKAEVLHSKIANYNCPDYPELEDFGDATLLGDNGATNYFRVDWLTPDGLGTWGDGRTVILGTEGYIELRKYIDIARDQSSNHVYLVNKEGEYHFEVNGKVGCPFFGELILDCLHRTEKAMTQEHAFLAAELCLKAQQMAMNIN